MSDAPGEICKLFSSIEAFSQYFRDKCKLTKLVKINLLVHLVVDPCLVTPHTMAPHKLHRTLRSSSVQTIVIGHHLAQKCWKRNRRENWKDLLSLGVGKHLIST